MIRRLWRWLRQQDKLERALYQRAAMADWLRIYQQERKQSHKEVLRMATNHMDALRRAK